MLLCAVVGCSKRAYDSIKPTDAYEETLIIPAGSGYDAVLAKMKIPSGYDQTASTSAGEFEVWRKQAEPQIIVRSSLAADGESHPDYLGKCESDQYTERRIVRRESRSDGEMFVCQDYSHDLHPRIEGTFVVRLIRRHNEPVECSVAFPAIFDLSSDLERDPSPERLADAIAICDSLTLRDISDQELERFRLQKEHAERATDAGS